MKIILQVFLLITVIACSEKVQNKEHISFDKTNGNFNKFFNKEQEYNIPTKFNDGTKLLNISKIYTSANGNFLISDVMTPSLLIVSRNGKLIKVVGKKGNGPGEFVSLIDFIYDENNNEIITLDFLQNAINLYSDFKFVKKIRLAFEHRFAGQILKCKNGNIIISALRNLATGSSKDNYTFLPFSENCYLNFYNSKYKLVRSFLNPSKKYNENMIPFARPQLGNYAPSAILEDNKIITMKQEGLYEIFIAECSGKITNHFVVHEPSFVKFDFSLVKEHKLINHRSNFKKEKIGEIIASYSSPVSIYMLSNYVLVTIMDPYDNYFPQFSVSGWDERTYHLDIFKYENGELIPIIGGIKMGQKIVGVTENNSILCINRRFKQDPEKIIIKQFRLKL